MSEHKIGRGDIP